MTKKWTGLLVSTGLALALLSAAAAPAKVKTGRSVVRTVPLPAGLELESGTYTPSGKLLVTYRNGDGGDPRNIRLDVMNDDGSAAHTIFKGRVPDRPKDNGIRFMVFADDKRVMLGDFVLECTKPLANCDDARLVPLTYPVEIADGEHIGHRWSEPIIAPDNFHYSWTTLLADYSALVLTGRLERRADDYRIADVRYIGTNAIFRPDPDHADGVLPEPVRGGEVKQYVRGGAAISMAGALDTVLANSTTIDLASGRIEATTTGPGYTETTIFSPDERLGMTMTTGFSPETDLAIFGLIPRPHPLSLQVGLNMFAYTYGVTGVRAGRAGNVGPALIDLAASRASASYRGINLAKDNGWTFLSPMSWHPGGRRATWPEIARGGSTRRLRNLELPQYRPGPIIKTVQTPPLGSYASADLNAIPSMMTRGRAIDVKVYGKISGNIAYRRSAEVIEKIYDNYSDDGQSVWSGRETTIINPRGNSRYTADLTLKGPKPGRMHLVATFGPISAPDHSRLIFDLDSSGQPQTQGYAEYAGTKRDLFQMAK